MQFQQQPYPDDSSTRKSRFTPDPPTSDPSPLPGGLRSRASSQPPRRNAPTDSYSTRIELAQRRFENSLAEIARQNGGVATSINPIWATPSSRPSSFGAGSHESRAVPIRSASFSASGLPANHNGGAGMGTREGSSFPSTFEDEEEDLSSFDEHEFYDTAPELRSSAHGRGISPEGTTRSRSQSLAAIRRPPIASPLPVPGSSGVPLSWGDPNHPSNRSLGPRRGDPLTPPTNSTGFHHHAQPNVIGSRRGREDLSNHSPFVRDVGQILLDDGSNFRDLGWNMGIRDDGGGSGTTSRRHSVSVVQPRRAVGFAAPEDIPTSIGGGHMDPLFEQGKSSFFGSGRLAIPDDELASDFNMLSLNLTDGPVPAPPHRPLPGSQPSSLPNYAPQSRGFSSPSAHDRSGSGFLPMNLPVPQAIDFTSSFGGQGFSPSGGYHDRPTSVSPLSASSPPRTNDMASRDAAVNRFDLGGGSQFSPRSSGFGGGGAEHRPHPIQVDQRQAQGQYGPISPQHSNMNTNVIGRRPSIQIPSQSGMHQQQQISPSSSAHPQQSNFQQGGPYGGSSNPASSSPTTLTFGRPPVHVSPQAGYFSRDQHQQQQLQSQPSLTDLGRGVPLHAVPPSSPLFIVEFKAGRTDLFYSTDPNMDIHVEDLVIVEADRGKDLGKVVNDNISLADVEVIQRQSLSAGMIFGEGGEGMPTKGMGKEIMPKRIYGKAQPQDTQYVVPTPRIDCGADMSTYRLLASKMQDELKALQLCQSKVRQKKLPMEVVDAEYQWSAPFILHLALSTKLNDIVTCRDRRKLTFYFIADRRIDFRELVRELFR
jgi:cell fate regulator YaaT (PSP1 superfamily)